jgi:phosphatidylinositol-3-phosphatase
LNELKTELDDPTSAPRFIYIVPNQCNDQHGLKSCQIDSVTAGDVFLSQTVPAIINSPSFTERSVLFILWEDGQEDTGCCGNAGGGRVPLIAVTKDAQSIKGTTPSNHYSLLATIEDGFKLPRLANAEKASTLFDVMPAFSFQHRAAAP